uniref:flavin monoamine oxidase family protein n=1 Tax=Tahibacter caeni TaxID=1453545 RepID=UPI0021497AEA
GESVTEALQRADAQRAARRRFLQQSAVAASALALAACAKVAPRPVSGEEVVIVGAGMAGLAAAWKLRRAGVPVRLIEAQTRCGGRMLSLRNHFADGQVCELGGELIDSGHERMRRLVRDLRLTLDDLTGDETPGLTDSWYFDGSLRSEHEVLQAFAPVAQAIRRDQLAIDGGDITPENFAAAQALDRQSLAEWFDRNGVSGWIRRLLDVAYTTEMGLECDRQSSLNLLTFISPRTDHLRLFGDSDERYHVRGGNDRVTSALAGKLADAIETGCVLEALRRAPDGRYRLALRRDGVSRELDAAQVVLAIPFTTLRQVELDLELPATKRAAIRGLGYGTNAKLMIGFERRVWRERHGSTGSLMCDLALQTTWETSRRQPGAAGILTNFVGGRHGLAIGEGTPKFQADQVVAELDAVFPGAAAARGAAREARFHWPSHPWTQGSYACFAPGDWTGLRNDIATSVGRLHFAGEHCSDEFQGFMEGALESGETVAERILAERHASGAWHREWGTGNRTRVA